MTVFEQAAIAAAQAAAESVEIAPPTTWRCADPPHGCGEVKPIGEFSFKPRANPPFGGGKDLCNQCKMTAPLRRAQRQTREEVHRILTRIGMQRAGEAAPPGTQQIWGAAAAACGGVEQLFAELVVDIEMLEQNNKFHSAGQLRMGLAKIGMEAAKHAEQLKPVQQLEDEDLLAERERRTKVIAQNVAQNVINLQINHYHGVDQAPAATPETIDAPAHGSLAE